MLRFLLSRIPIVLRWPGARRARNFLIVRFDWFELFSFQIFSDLLILSFLGTRWMFLLCFSRSAFPSSSAPANTSYSFIGVRCKLLSATHIQRVVALVGADLTQSVCKATQIRHSRINCLYQVLVIHVRYIVLPWSVHLNFMTRIRQYHIFNVFMQSPLYTIPRFDAAPLCLASCVRTEHPPSAERPNRLASGGRRPTQESLSIRSRN